MKISNILLLFLACICRNASAQWETKLSLHKTSFYSVSFPDNNTGYAVGKDGSIVKTTDAGETWLEQSSGTTENLLSVYFTSATTGYVAGRDGIILKTSNGGINWLSINTGRTNELECIYFTDSLTGYAAGAYGNILKTTDAGAHWWLIAETSTAMISSICFTDENTGYAVDHYGSVFKTTDAGTSWQQTETGTHRSLLHISFADDSTGYIVGSGAVIFKTSNAGRNWIPQKNDVRFQIYSAAFTDARHGSAVTFNSVILNTTDGGETWVSDTSHMAAIYHTPFYKDPQGDYTSDEFLAAVSYTMDNECVALYSICFTPNGTGYAVGENGTILKLKTKPEPVAFSNPVLHTQRPNILMFPNPAADLFTLSLDLLTNPNLQLNIYNMMGAVVYSQLIDRDQQQIDLGSFINGVYIVEVRGKDWSQKQKLLIRK